MPRHSIDCLQNQKKENNTNCECLFYAERQNCTTIYVAFIFCIDVMKMQSQLISGNFPWNILKVKGNEIGSKSVKKILNCRFGFVWMSGKEEEEAERNDRMFVLGFYDRMWIGKSSRNTLNPRTVEST